MWKSFQTFQSGRMSDSAFKQAGKNDPACKFCAKAISCSKTTLQHHDESTEQESVVAKNQVGHREKLRNRY